MKHFLKIFIYFLFLTPLYGEAKAPKLTVFIVVDQFSAQYIPRFRPFLSGGIKFLSDEGTYYVNAFYDHSMPGTGPGHTLLSTGTYASFHGIMSNGWYTPEGNYVACDDDTAEHAAVFAPDGSFYSFGKSARNIMTDTLSDQLILHSYPHARNTVWALSLKSRAAIALGGRLGKALWFDGKSGNFTSKAYFEKLPDWVTEFNQKHALGESVDVTWKPFYELDSKAYGMSALNFYQYTIFNESIIGKPQCVNFSQNEGKMFELTPDANRRLLDLAIECIEKNYKNDEQERFVLYLSISGLDLNGHIFGPDSNEIADFMYHLDNQLKEFIDKIYAKVEKEEVLFVLTGDHGVCSIPEVLESKGFNLARRYNFTQIIEHLNKLIEKKYNLTNVVQHFREPQFYLNQSLLGSVTCEIREALEEDIKSYLLSLPGIRHAWTYEELRNTTFQDFNPEKYIQRQLFKGRSGDILYACDPYTMLYTYEPDSTKGTTHHTPYAYDTQVPLVFYRAGHYEKKRVTSNVSMTQVPVSLSTLFEVPRPSASTAGVLPELDV